MSGLAVIGAIAVALTAWILLFRGDRADIWPRTWAVAGALIAYSLLVLVALDRVDTVFDDPGLSDLALGAGVGTAWLVATHVGHAVLCRIFPSFIDQVQDLYRLGVDDPPSRVAGPIIAMSVAEELLFRGVVQGIAGFGAAVALYTSVQLVERKWALVLAALLGGIVWGALFTVTGGAVAPIVAHALWTVSLTLIWPLRGCGRRTIRTPIDQASVDQAGVDQPGVRSGPPARA